MPCGKSRRFIRNGRGPSLRRRASAASSLCGLFQKGYSGKIKKADPEDIKGVHFKYTFRHLPYIEKVQRMVNDSAKDGGPKDYKTAHAYVNKQLKTPGLTPLQKQQVMAARFWLYRNEGKRTRR